MINRKQIILQTKAASFEKKQERNALQIIRYSKSDYISFHLIRTWIYSALAFFTVFFWIMLYRIDALSVRFDLDAMLAVGLEALFAFGIVSVVYLCVGMIFYGKKYDRAQKECRAYKNVLKKLQKVQTKLEKQE